MAIPADQLGKAVLAYLLQQGLDPLAHMLTSVTVTMQDNVAAITKWDVAMLGPQPTLAQLEAALVNYANLRGAYDRTRDLADMKMRALARAVHVRFGRPDAATMTAATWRSILEAAWDAERG